MDDLRKKIAEAFGEVSMCWSETPNGVFDSSKALKILEDLCGNFIVCTPNERAFLDEIREKGGYSDAMYIKTAHYQPHYEPGLWLGEGTCIWQKDFTKSNLKELVNEQ